jgi:hypothetical protein
MIGNEDWPWRRLSKMSLIDAQTSAISSNGDTILVQEFLHTTVGIQPVFYGILAGGYYHMSSYYSSH